ncbi:hypothetical protein TELCIR_20044 [Teladorsagia circumcincta]|uniref:Uncharacterized protein n=1 Tax=Teladorsagia circumcincta TaxID=45464 RepID=A0A2G9TKW9_TELCI|nr:hypothetical protein TELCIR_20044 [Teladorsagia circumcincta]
MGAFELSIVHSVAEEERFSSEVAANPVVKQDWIECRRSFEYVALELQTEVDADDILADVDCEFVDGTWAIRNKRGEMRTVDVSEKCFQIFSDLAMLIIERNL